MSLSIYFDGVDTLPDMKLLEDVNAWFYYISIDGCSYDKLILRDIEQGEYLSNSEFLDRFGRPLPRNFMSTGSKCALLVYHSDNALVNGAELWRNALKELLEHCDRGNLLLPAKNFGISCDSKDTVVDIVCKGRHYTSLYEFAEYLMEDAPYEAEDRN